jgi:thiamine biosynthesis lipoprotein
MEIAAIVLALAQGESRIWKGEAMGSGFEIQASGADGAVLDKALQAARDEVARLDRMMTDWKETGPLMEINRQAGSRPVEVPRDLFFILKRSLQVSELTDGAFDITFASAGRLWRWWETNPPLPSPEEVRAALANVGWRHLRLDEAQGTAYLDRPGCRIGLGAIGPGYAADLALRKMKELGVHDALVNLSGDVVAAGTHAGRPWEISIRHPRRPGEAFAVLPVSNLAVSTSGDYERFFLKDGKRYGHIIDPRTGYPADGCQSATVTAPSLALADALATAVFVLGPVKGMELIERLDAVEALIVAADGTVSASSGLKRRDP